MKSTVALCRFIFAFLLLGAADSRAADATGDCSKLTDSAEIYTCLNAYAKTQLAKGGAADRAFESRLGRLLAKYDLVAAQVRTKGLAESFQIIVDQNSQRAGSDQSKACFNFDVHWWQQGERAGRIKLLQSQIEQAALFLADLHAASWGHQVSLLFPVKEVSICSLSLNQRPFSFEQRTLHIGLGSELLAAHEIRQAWDSGHPVRGSDLEWYAKWVPYVGPKIRQIRQLKSPDHLIRDKIAEKWMILNPTGSLRTTALYTLAEAVFKVRTSLDQDPSHSRFGGQFDLVRAESILRDVLSGPGFSASDKARFEELRQDPVSLAALYNLWRQKIFSPQNILNVIENAIGDQARRDSNLHMTLRKINAGVSIANDKNIAVRLEQLMQNAIPVGDFAESAGSSPNSVEFSRTETNTRPDGTSRSVTTTVRANGIDAKDITVNGDEVAAGVSINLIDNVVVSVQIPNVSAPTYRRVCLHQAMSELGGNPVLP